MRPDVKSARTLGVARSVAVVLLQIPITGAIGAERDFPQLVLPVNCELGSTCFVQSYLDHDPTGLARDFHCGPKTYDGHDGTDFRVPDLSAEEAGVEVLAAASGRILRTRDGMDDVSVAAIGKAAVAGKECGNAVVIRHDDHWSTQYCHMRKGSVRVKPGDSVSAGQPIGLVGMSGMAEFPHLHLTVRKDDLAMDPFAYGFDAASCSGGTSLWDQSALEALAYREIELINFGFAGGPVQMSEIESGAVRRTPLGPDTALVAYARAIGLRAGDVCTIEVRRQDGSAFASYRSAPLDANKAQHYVSAGRKAGAGKWSGTYVATYSVERAGAVIFSWSFELRI